MALRLSPEDQNEYIARAAKLQEQKEQCIKYGLTKEAKIVRQRLSALYKEFESRQLPCPEPEQLRVDLSYLSMSDLIEQMISVKNNRAEFQFYQAVKNEIDRRFSGEQP